jgi:twitching motility protein PilT
MSEDMIADHPEYRPEEVLENIPEETQEYQSEEDSEYSYQENQETDSLADDQAEDADPVLTELAENLDEIAGDRSEEPYEPESSEETGSTSDIYDENAFEFEADDLPVESSDENPDSVLDDSLDQLLDQMDDSFEDSDELPVEEYSETEGLEHDEYDPEAEIQEIADDDFETTDEEVTEAKAPEAETPPVETKAEEPEAPQFVLEDVKKEMQAPLNLENTAKYMMSLPILGQIVKEQYLINIGRETDDVKLRAIRVATQKEIIADLKEKRQPYIITHFTNQESLCNVDKNCEFKFITSVYYEVSNPVTNKNVMLTSQMFHNITRHQMAYFNEPLLNLGNSPQGFYDAYLQVGDLLTALNNSNAPDEVIDELKEIRDKIDYLEDQRFASVRANIKWDMSVFEQTEYEKEHNIIPFYSLLRTLVAWGAEDIHIKANFRPMGVLGGDVKPCPDFPDFLDASRTKYYSNYLMTEPQIAQFEETLEMDNSFYVPGVARFRCNMYHSQGAVGMVFRVIPTKIRPVEALGVPMILKKLVFERLGLCLVTGQTGSGKTTTLAAIVEFCNVNRAIHTLTLENPVEYVYESKKSVFTQRAIEIDSLSFPMAMRGALRQKPDIILIGEMRDPDTIMAGLKAAETGHLVMSTLHTNDAVQTINRIVNTFPPHEQETIRVQVGSTIKACVAQRLIPRFDKPGRVCAIEVMLVTPNARGLNTRGYIIRNEVPELYKVVATSGYDGMQSMNMALFEHYRNGVITPDDALSYSDNPDEVTRWMREDMGLGVGSM